MKRILPLILSAFALNAWGQVPVQVQTQSKNYDLSDAYRITFEDGGATQVIHTRSQGEIRIPLVDLKQIHFNDTTVSLVNQIKALENCEIMKALLLEDASYWSSAQFMPYLNASSITHVFIPNDEAFQAIPIVYNSKIPAVLSVTLDKSDKSFPFKSQLRRYDPETGEVGTLLGSNFSDSQLIYFLERLVLNQFAVGSGPYLRTLSGSVVKETDNGYQGIYELEGNENQYRKGIHVVQQIPDLENRKCVVTDAVVSDAMKGTYEVLQEMSPKFLELLDGVPLDLLVEVGLIEADDGSSPPDFYLPDLSYFEMLDFGNQKFRWNSSKVNFTILALTDEAIDEAFRDGSLLTWTEIKELADNLMLSPDWVTQGRYEVKEKVVDLLAFINRHILFGNLLVDVPRNTELQIPTCAVTGNHVSQTVLVRRDAEDGFTVSSGKVVPGTIRYVIEAESSDASIKFSETMQSGLVMQIDKAIMNN